MDGRRGPGAVLCNIAAGGRPSPAVQITGPLPSRRRRLPWGEVSPQRLAAPWRGLCIVTTASDRHRGWTVWPPARTRPPRGWEGTVHCGRRGLALGRQRTVRLPHIDVSSYVLFIGLLKFKNIFCGTVDAEGIPCGSLLRIPRLSHSLTRSLSRTVCALSCALVCLKFVVNLSVF